MNRRQPIAGRDQGFTLTELLVTIVVTGIIVPVIAASIVVAFRTLPATEARADSGVAVQGLATWLPADVDSTQPGGLDADPGAASGCQGSDPGANVVRLTWTETFRKTTTRYVAAYRFVVTGDSAHIVRLSCSGSASFGPAATLSMSGPLTTRPPVVTVLDIDHDGLDDRVRLSVETLAGQEVYIDAVSKNPGESLPSPPPTVPSSSTTTTTTTTVPNQPPVAAPVLLTANAGVPVVVHLPVSDPDGDPLTVSVTAVPAGWTAIATGTAVTVTPTAPPGTKTFGYTVSDAKGGLATSTITVTVVTSATTTTTSTTTTSTTTSTTVPPPCVVSAMSVSPSSVSLTAKGTGQLKRNVRVSISLGAGYCVGLTLQYETGGPNGQYVQNFGTGPQYVVTLVGQPTGTELWSVGPHDLVVKDGTGLTLASKTLTVTD